jgi:hypothetical protein
MEETSRRSGSPSPIQEWSEWAPDDDVPGVVRAPPPRVYYFNDDQDVVDVDDQDDECSHEQ